MTKRLYSLRDVPEDEIQELKELLQQQNIDFYETAPGNWGISAGALWLRNDEQFEKAQQLMAQYHTQRANKAKVEHELLVKQGKASTLLENFKRAPLQLLFYIAFILFILYVSIKPFLFFGG